MNNTSAKPLSASNAQPVGAANDDSLLEPKKKSLSAYTYTKMTLPENHNNFRHVFGGDILRYLDEAASICANRHAGRVVTAAVERFEFIAPVDPGDVMLMHCSVNLVTNMALEVGVRIEAENMVLGNRRHVGTAYVTFVGIDSEGKPRKVARIIPETEDDRRRMKDAARRMAFHRMERKLSRNESLYYRIESLRAELALVQLCPDFPLHALEPGAIYGIMRDGNTFSAILDQKMAELPSGNLAAKQCDLAGFRLSGPFERGTSFALSSIISILEAKMLTVYSLSNASTELFFVPASQEQSAIDVLRQAGHELAL